MRRYLLDTKHIAAIALSMGNTTVVSADIDLTAVPGLAVENWVSG